MVVGGGGWGYTGITVSMCLCAHMSFCLHAQAFSRRSLQNHSTFCNQIYLCWQEYSAQPVDTMLFFVKFAVIIAHLVLFSLAEKSATSLPPGARVN